MQHGERKAAVALLSVLSNTTLVIAKLVIGILIGSVSVISEAIHSGVDLAAALIAWFAVKTSGRPADKEHPFGHGKIENISGTIEAALIFLAAGWIVFEAVKKLINPRPMDEAGWGIAVMLVSSVANIIVSQRLFKVGRETESVALQADAWHLRTDVYTSAGVMFGLCCIWAGRLLLPNVNIEWVDPVAAIAVALLIVKAAYELTRDAARDLLDASLPSDEEEWIRQYLSGLTPTVRGFGKLRTRKSGSQRFIDFRLMVRPDMSVDEAHEVIQVIEREVEGRFLQVSVTVHLVPCHCSGKPDCPNVGLLNEAYPPPA